VAINRALGGSQNNMKIFFTRDKSIRGRKEKKRNYMREYRKDVLDDSLLNRV